MAEKRNLLLGIDIGTTDTKCSVYTPTGEVVASHFSEYGMIHPRSGWVEENPEDWWKAICENLRMCREEGLDLHEVRGVCVSCTNAFIPVTRDVKPLHNAIMQIDQRAAQEVGWIEEHIGSERIFEITGNRVARGTFFMPTVLWYLHNCPEIVREAYKFLTPSGYAVAKLTDEFTINESRMGFSLMSEIRTGQWSRELVEAMGMDMEKLPRPCRADEIVGHVTARAAAETGLKEGTPVAGGAMDTVSAAVGAGAVTEGDVFMALGTCGRICHSSASEHFDRRIMNCRNAGTGQYLNVDATNNCGVALRWFRDRFGAAANAIPEVSGMNIYAAMDLLAERAAPGAGGVIFLPYFSGERCPIWDPDAKGAFIGMQLGTGFGDMVRAVLEGVAFSLRQGLELMNITEGQPIALGGGIANSRIWCEIIANVLKHPIIRTDVNETETLGCAILVGHAIGLIDDMGEIGKRLIAEGETIFPEKEQTAIYDERYALYLELYERLKPVFPKLRMD